MTKEPRRPTLRFAHHFNLPSFQGPLPPGPYTVAFGADSIDHGCFRDCLNGSVTIYPYPGPSGLTLSQSFTAPWREIEDALILDRDPTCLPAEMVLEQLLADPIVHQLMRSDGVSDAKVREAISHMPQDRP